MRRSLFAVICCLCIATAPALDNPPLPANTSWLVNIDVRQALSGPFGEVAREAVSTSCAKNEIRNWLTITGIDPLRDIDRVVASGVDFTPTSSTILLIGRFDAGRLTALAEAAQGHQAVSHHDTVIHRWIDSTAGNREVFAALIGGQLLFASNLDSAKRSLDALALDAPASGVATIVQRFPGPVIAVAAVNDLDHLPRLDQNAAMLRQVKRLAASLQSEGDQVLCTVIASAADEATAGQLLQIGQGLLALAALNKDTPLETKALLAGVQLTRTGNELIMKAAIPLATIRAGVAKGAGK